LDGAIGEYREALRIQPGYANAHYNLGNILFRKGEVGEAIQELQKALELRPGNVDYENGLAWVLSTASQISLRNGARALELATVANQSTGGNNPLILHTLAAACAESGDFPKAVETAHKALQLLESQPENPLVRDLNREIKLYEAGRQY
jgi:tetratricopeptide (TPR) repeat protein